MHETINVINLNIVMAQINLFVGDISGNVERVLHEADRAKQEGAKAVVFPELTLTGYPPEDLLHRKDLDFRIEQALSKLLSSPVLHDQYIILGYPKRIDGELYNAAGVLYQGEIIAQYCKQFLPNYQVFDEQRYFSSGDESCVFHMEGVPIALTICEDLWHEKVTYQAYESGAKLIISINASPFSIGKLKQRYHVVSERAKEVGLPIFYVNQIGAQDELVFDGGSFVMNEMGQLCGAAPCFAQSRYQHPISYDGESCVLVKAPSLKPYDERASLYSALVLGLQDYAKKNKFKTIILGLSGGVDSALSLSIAVDALGAENVHAVMMPFRYTSEMSLTDAKQQAELLCVDYRIVSIESLYVSFMDGLPQDLSDKHVGLAEQNLQSRCRALVLMYLSNKHGHLVISTGNKSELSVGYATLYGDMCGGFNPLKDVSKLNVYELCRYRNTLSLAIPERVIERAPSAELAPDQVDTDSLPPYEILDPILEDYIEHDLSVKEIIDKGYDEGVVNKIIALVKRSEYKRRQAVIGPRVTSKGFGRDRRYPITSGWNN
jgi:NAD+ synthase (glutamine-hydrolysing)